MMTTLEKTQAELALARLKMEKLLADYETTNPEAIYWHVRFKRVIATLKEASMHLMELESIEIPSNEN